MTDHYIYGIHAVAAVLARRLRPIKKLFVNEDRADKRLEHLLSVASESNTPIEYLSLQSLNQRFPAFTHQGVVAMVAALPEYVEADLFQLLEMGQAPHLILILDGITDPHNLGACLRSADGAGASFVVIPRDKNAPVTPVVSKVACGAAESVPIVRVTNLARAMDVLKQEGIWIYGASGDAEGTLYELDCKSSIAFVLGAEDKGMRHLTRTQCDGLFALPMLGTVSSLNVSVATGVCLYEAVRQRSFLNKTPSP
ncbi:MAG: 23S rRNA (guanosine(2251)-2'-O)-methyltransferase RlmB [Legionellales bacterium]|nr:23S rRNA (guanosine(2251)-2'-O)-methyltransferase RlmB [Legionellales bacterium]